MSLPSTYRPLIAEDFIGPARKAALLVQRLIEAGMPNRDPFKLMLLGEPGRGKTELANLVVRLIGPTKWSTHRYNGASFRIEDAEELARQCHYSTLFDDYRVIQIEEVDRVSHAAQVRLLTLLDDLPKGNAIICTSNCRPKDLEPRFHSRLRVLTVPGPDDAELEAWLVSKFKVPCNAAKQIATFAQGCVRQALQDADMAVV